MSQDPKGDDLALVNATKYIAPQQYQSLLVLNIQLCSIIGSACIYCRLNTDGISCNIRNILKNVSNLDSIPLYKRLLDIQRMLYCSALLVEISRVGGGPEEGRKTSCKIYRDPKSSPWYLGKKRRVRIPEAFQNWKTN